MAYIFICDPPDETVIRRTNDAHDVQELILVVSPSEERDTRDHLGEDTTARPDVN